MKIGIDAYFAFHYKTGVAHYTRTLINGLAALYPDIGLILFTDQPTELYQPSFPNVQIAAAGVDIAYHEWLDHPALSEMIEAHQPVIFHGTDHGLPRLNGCKRVVTVHDLFFESHPQYYSPEDIAYYRKKTPEACQSADAIIAISEFTKEAITSTYAIDRDKIKVCYQSCNRLFFQKVNEDRKTALRKQFDLPDQFWLYVGSVIERKNLLRICAALQLVRDEMDIPLIVVGEGAGYLQKVRTYLQENNLAQRVRFLSYTDAARNSLSFQQARDVPAFYQMATALLYPSQLEGFGIPLIEAFASGLPVLTSNTSSLPEIGGDAALYADPLDVNQLASRLQQLRDKHVREKMIAKGKEIVRNFMPEKTTQAIMQVYQELL